MIDFIHQSHTILLDHFFRTITSLGDGFTFISSSKHYSIKLLTTGSVSIGDKFTDGKLIHINQFKPSTILDYRHNTCNSL
jgi:hypothetical protein